MGNETARAMVEHLSWLEAEQNFYHSRREAVSIANAIEVAKHYYREFGGPAYLREMYRPQ